VVVDPGEERRRTHRPPCQDGRLEILRIEDITNDPIAAIFVGRDHGANVSFFIVSCGRGQGPQPHRHPYEETFVVLEGRSAFSVGEETFDVEAGSIVVAPAGVVHSFKGAIDGVTRQVNIHPVAEMVTEWVDET
jgi:quercetin dioxygenase-like cupin family protein